MDPELYLESKNVPDVCILYKKAVDCIGNETSYDWYDYFKENCFEWDRNEGNSSNHGNGMKNRNCNNNSDNDDNKNNKNNDDNNNDNNNNNKNNNNNNDNNNNNNNNNNKNKNDNNNSNNNNNYNENSNKSFNNSSNNDNEDDVNSTIEDPIISKPDTAEVKVRYDNAIRSLEKSGIAVRKKGGSIVSREMFAWISDQCS